MSREKIESTDWLTRDIPKEQLERKKRVAIMSADLQECHTEFFSNAELYTDYDETARQMDDKGYRKQSENMVELPCKVGDTVWCIYNYTKPKEFQIDILTMSKNHYSFTIKTKDGIYKHYCDKEAVDKWVFFTKEEAEEALAKMKGGAE